MRISLSVHETETSTEPILRDTAAFTMSRDNIERTRAALEAFNEHDIERQISFTDQEVEFHSTFAAVGGAVYHGHAGLRQWHRDLEEAWGEEIVNKPERFFDLGARTLIHTTLYARGRHSGAEVEMPIAQLFEWRDGLLVYFKTYVDRDEALRDLGVSEAALEASGH